MIDLNVRKKSVSDKLKGYALKNAEHLHFDLCTGMLDIYFIKKYKNKIQKKTPTIQINSLKGICWTGAGRVGVQKLKGVGYRLGDLSLLQS